MSQFDLVLKSGQVFDPDSGLFQQRDVAISDGQVVSVGDDVRDDDESLVNVSGKLVCPGLVDAHSHVYPGVTLNGIAPDQICPAGGVTTTVDGGSSGTRTFEGFRQWVVGQSRTRVLCYVNLSSIGLTASRIIGELSDSKLADPSGVARLLRTYPEVAVGIKLRISRSFVGGPCQPYVEMAAEVSRQTGRPLHLHIGDSVEPMSEVLGWLSPGDMVTHYQTPKPNGLVDQQGRVLDAAREARERGVHFDCGHGSTHFSFSIAAALLDQGFPPDMLSSDQSRHGPGQPSPGLLEVVNRWIALGLPVADALRAVTSRPADILGQAATFGRLTEGLSGDVTVLNWQEGDFLYRDAMGAELRANRRLVVEATIRGGDLLWSSPDFGSSR